MLSGGATTATFAPAAASFGRELLEQAQALAIDILDLGEVEDGARATLDAQFELRRDAFDVGKIDLAAQAAADRLPSCSLLFQDDEQLERS